MSPPNPAAAPPSSGRHRVVVVGGGFAGLSAVRALARAPVEITLLDRRNYHLFQPLLYQVATGGLSPADISAPLRGVLRRQKNVAVLLGEVQRVDVDGRRVVLERGSLPYDSLIVATGATHHYFGNEKWPERAPGLKTIEDATAIRGRILRAFEDAERESDEAARRALLTFVVVGAGPTGVELAGAIGELAAHTLKRDFRRIDPASARILLVEAADRPLPPYPEPLSKAAAASLAGLGVEVMTGTRIEEIRDDGVVLASGRERREVAAATVLWAAGVQASPLAAGLAAQTGAELDRNGRIRVEPDCSLPGHPEIVVLGDMIRMDDEQGQPLPGVAPVAMQQGRYAARRLKRRLAGRPVPPFRYRDRGSLAVIGRAAAVAELGPLRFSGYPAWLLWLFVHIMYLVGFANRVLVLFQWAYSYLTRGRGARLITGESSRLESPPPAGR